MTMAVGMAVEGVRLGHWTYAEGETGCSVVEFPAGTTASHEVRGGAPASRELDLLEPDKTIERVDAVMLTGGSAFGLAAADGVMRYYAERGRGAATPEIGRASCREAGSRPGLGRAEEGRG